MAAVNDYRQKTGVNMHTKMTISPDNIKLLSKAVINLIENNYTHINLNCVFEEGWNNEHASILYNELNKITDWLYEKDLIDKVFLSIFNDYIGKPLDPKNNRNWCGGTGLMLGFNHTGNAYPCLRYMESSNQKYEPYIIGSLKDGINIDSEHRKRVDCLSCITRES